MSRSAAGRFAPAAPARYIPPPGRRMKRPAPGGGLRRGGFLTDEARLRPRGDPEMSDFDAMAAQANRERVEEDAEVGGIAADRLRSIIDRIERLEEERKALAGDIKDIYAEAKSAGFEPKVIRKLISLRKQEPAEIEELETLLELYRRALGM